MKSRRKITAAEKIRLHKAQLDYRYPVGESKIEICGSCKHYNSKKSMCTLIGADAFKLMTCDAFSFEISKEWYFLATAKGRFVYYMVVEIGETEKRRLISRRIDRIPLICLPDVVHENIVYAIKKEYPPSCFINLVSEDCQFANTKTLNFLRLRGVTIIEKDWGEYLPEMKNEDDSEFDSLFRIGVAVSETMEA